MPSEPIDYDHESPYDPGESQWGDSEEFPWDCDQGTQW